MDSYFDFLILAEERFSVRSFTGEPVPQDVVARILHAGHVAPTACNLQPQRIYVLESEDALAKLKHCTPCHFNAPLAFLVCANMDECWVRPFDGQLSGTIDASIVATHMMLQAAAEGIGCTWVMHFDPEALAEEFSIPETTVPVCLLVMGCPADGAVPAPGHMRKRPAQEIVTRL